MVSRKTVVVALILLAALAVAKECPTERSKETKEYTLHEDLLCGYNSDYRPVKDHKTAVTVRVRLAVKYVSFDSSEETLTIHSWVALSWNDEFLTWDPANYGGIDETQLQSHEIWSPELAHFNADASYYNADSIYTTCTVNHSGTVSCVPHLAHNSICRSKLTRWPYDSQNCSLYFGSWMHTGEQINFTFYKSDPVVLDDKRDGPGWTVKGVINKRIPGKFGNSSYPMLVYTFMLERTAAGLAAIIVVPSVVIVVLTMTSLLMDVKYNTRLFLACFSLFGHFTYLSEIGKNLPKHSADTPIILLFIRDSMMLSLFAICVTLLLMWVRRRRVPAPSWMTMVTRITTSGPAQYLVFTDFDPSDPEGAKIADDMTDDAASNDRAKAASEWIQFANMFNSFVFIISFLVYVILIFAYIPYKA